MSATTETGTEKPAAAGTPVRMRMPPKLLARVDARSSECAACPKKGSSSCRRRAKRGRGKRLRLCPRGELEEPGARRAPEEFAGGGGRRFELLLPAQRQFLFELRAEVVAT